jgi:hypothetical protein
MVGKNDVDRDVQMEILFMIARIYMDRGLEMFVVGRVDINRGIGMELLFLLVNLIWREVWKWRYCMCLVNLICSEVWK